MTLEVPNVRNALIDDLIKKDLDEILRFRHGADFVLNWNTTGTISIS